MTDINESRYDTVAIIGLGKIGSLKAGLYRRLGLDVIAVDSRPDTVEDVFVYPSLRSLFENGVNPFLFDVSVPTDLHVSVIERILEKMPNAHIIVEKPVASTLKDCKRIEKVLRIFPFARILVNENYILSSATQYLKTVLQKYNLTIERVYCDFSKDRVQDVHKGRFTDTKLGAFGIEVSHSIGVLEEIGLQFEKIVFSAQEHMTLPNGETLKEQGGCFLKYVTRQGTFVNIYQSLVGRAHLLEKYFTIPNDTSPNKSYRVMKIHCRDGIVVYVQYEPIGGYERFTSRVVVANGNRVLEDVYLEDNSMEYSLKHAVEYFQQRSPKKSPLSIQNGIRISKILYSSKAAAQKIDTIEKDFKIYPHFETHRLPIQSFAL